MESSKFSLKELSLDSLPTSAAESRYKPLLDELTSSALSLLASLPGAEWTQHKTRNTPVHPTLTYQKPAPSLQPSGLKWHARISEHEGESYEQWWQGLGVRHSEKEAEYIESCVKAERIQVIQEGEMEVWRTAYHLPFPTSNRDFTFLIITLRLPPPGVSTSSAGAGAPLGDPNAGTNRGAHPSPPPAAAPIASSPESDDPNRSFVVISLPVSYPRQKGWVRAKYVSVEKVDEFEGGRRVRWSMATATDVGGIIPKVFVEGSMLGKISEDVPSFIDWLRVTRGEGRGSGPGTEGQGEVKRTQEGRI